MSSISSLCYIKSIKNAVREMMKVQTMIISFVNGKESIDSILEILQQFNILGDKCKFYDFLSLLNSIYYKNIIDKSNFINQIIYSIKNQIIETFSEEKLHLIFCKQLFNSVYDINKNAEKVDQYLQESNKPSQFSVNQEEENYSNIVNIIRSDDVVSFKNFITKTNLPLDSKVSDSSIKTFEFICGSLIEYSAAFGSINVFKYLYENLETLPRNVLSSAIYSENLEIIHLLEKKGIKLINFDINRIISYYKNKVFDYFISTDQIKCEFSLVGCSIRSKNYYVLNELFEKNPCFLTNINYINCIFSAVCINDIRTLFNALYSIPDLDVNISLEIFFLVYEISIY